MEIILLIQILKIEFPNCYGIIIELQRIQFSQKIKDQLKQLHNFKVNEIDDDRIFVKQIQQIDFKSVLEQNQSLFNFVIQNQNKCAICFEQFPQTSDDPQLTILSILCGHLFHYKCLLSWKGQTCPVCRQHFNPQSSQQCDSCENISNLWICLICGNIGCGSVLQQNSHNYTHYLQSKHIYSMDIISKEVFDHSSKEYVKRLIMNQVDGKLLQLKDDSEKNSIEQIIEEFSNLIIQQSLSQKEYYQELQQENKQKKQEQNRQLIPELDKLRNENNQQEQVLIGLQKQEIESNNQLNEIKSQFLQLISQKAQLEKQQKILIQQSQKLQNESQQSRQMRDQLLDNQIKQLKQKIEEAREELQDCKAHLKIEKKISEISSQQQLDLQSNLILIKEKKEKRRQKKNKSNFKQ